MATIREVAKASGVSVTTVSVVLNNAPRPVHPETRKRVVAVARQLNYHPNAIARSLVSRRTYSIGVQFAVIEAAIVTNYYATGVLGGIFSEATAHGYDIHLFTRPWENAAVSSPRIKAQRTDGALLVSPANGSDMASGLEHARVPVVVLSAPSDVEGVPFVDVDNAAGVRMALEHFFECGHRRIAHLAGDLKVTSARARLNGFRQVMEVAGYTVHPDDIVGFSVLPQETYQAARALLERPDCPTAIFAWNDKAAFEALRAARDVGVRIPEDVSLIGFDDAPGAEYTTPPLTTIRHPLFQIGKEATRLLIKRIEGEPLEQTEIILTPERVIRGTTAPPRR